MYLISPSSPISTKHSRYCRSKKYGSMYSIMEVGELSEAEVSIHDSDIDNRNIILFEKAAQVINDCKDLSMYFLN